MLPYTFRQESRRNRKIRESRNKRAVLRRLPPLPFWVRARFWAEPRLCCEKRNVIERKNRKNSLSGLFFLVAKGAADGRPVCKALRFEFFVPSSRRREYAAGRRHRIGRGDVNEKVVPVLRVALFGCAVVPFCGVFVAKRKQRIPHFCAIFRKHAVRIHAVYLL